jgi:hypothetical protein
MKRKAEGPKKFSREVLGEHRGGSMDQRLFQEELRDLKTWQRKCRRLNRVADLMSDKEIIERATLLASENGVAQWYDNLRAEAKRNSRPAFLTGIVGAPGEPTKQSEHDKLQKLFAKL